MDSLPRLKSPPASAEMIDVRPPSRIIAVPARRPVAVSARRPVAVAMHRSVAVALLATMLGLGALLSGCGSSSPNASNPVARAAYISSDETGMRFTLKLRLAYSKLYSHSFEITGSGYAGRDGHNVKMTMNLSGIPGVTGLPSGGRGVEAVYVYPTFYMRLPFLADKLPEGKSWLEIDISKVLQASGGKALPQALGIGQVDPTQFLQYLKASTNDVKEVGAEELYGVPTTRYDVKLRLSSILRVLPADQRIAARPMLEHTGNANAMPLNVWIDARGRVRQVQAHLTIAGATLSGKANITVGFTEYGHVPAVTPPAEGEVVNLTSLLSGGVGNAFED